METEEESATKEVPRSDQGKGKGKRKSPRKKRAEEEKKETFLYLGSS